MAIATSSARMPILAGVTAAAALLALPAFADQRHFPTAQAAMDGLMSALSAGDKQGVLAIFGEEHAHFLIGDDEAQARAEWRNVYRAAKEATVLRPDGEGRYIVVVGRRAWPLPIPIVQDDDGWRFDTEAGIEEVTNRRIGRNELAAMDLACNYVEAQRIYASVDYNGDHVLEYAQHLISTPNRQDGLYWPATPETGPSPFGPYISEVSEYLTGKKRGDPYRGYYFRVLAKQGPNAPGGAYDYIINGHMIAGFALVAWPAEYGTTGIMTFLISHQGRLLQKDLGSDTEQIVAAMQAYDPDASWTDAKE